MDSPLRLLLIEDCEDDSLLLLDALHRAGFRTSHRRVDTREGMQQALREETWDLILSDYCMPEFDAPGAIQTLKESHLDIPLIVVSGTVGEDVAVETLQLGADDYLLKDNLTRLVPAVQRAIQIAETRRQRRSFEHMKTLFMENLLDMICTIDARGCFIEVSDACSDMLGYSPAELVGRPFMDFVHPDDHDATSHEAEVIMRGHRTRDFQNRYIHRDGRTVHLLWSAAWSNPDALMIAVARDMTEHRRSTEALRLREQALGQVSQGVLITDENHHIIYTNASFSSITGYSPEDAMGRNCRFLQGPATDPATLEKIRTRLRSQAPFEGEILNYRKDGTPFWNDLSITPLIDEGGGPIRFVGIQRDVTERKKAEQDLASALEHLKLAVKAGGVGIWDHDMESGEVTWDTQMLALYGKTPADVEPGVERWAVAIHPEDVTTAMAVYETSLRSGRDSFELEFRIIRRNDGAERIIHAIGSIIRDSSGRPVRMTGINWDVTEERLREQKLTAALVHEKELAEKARAGERAKSEFLAVMSHEVRTPLNGIIGFAELLSQVASLAPEHRDFARTISQSGESLMRILDDILDFSRLEAGRVEVENAPFQPAELLEDVRGLLATQASEKNLQFVVFLDPSLPEHLLGDAGRLRQVLLNLAGNAIKFTDQGSILLSLKPAPDSEKSLVFSVRDTGSGISQDQLDRIFEPFIQADSSISRRHGGTGLGLAISRRLTECLGGRLTVKSQPGLGSEFFVTLPLRTPEHPSPPQTAGPLRELDTTFAASHPLRVLIVEDDTVNLKLIQTLIRRLGYTPLTALNGYEAVETFRKHHPDCLLMDLQMPEMDGIEATRRIRQLEKETPTRHPYISALTANIFPADRQRCFDAGMDDYLNKPVKLASLAEILAKAYQSRTAV